MRDIKFRAWNINQKQMFWWDLLWGNHRQGDGYIGMVPWGEKQTRHIHRDNMTLIDPDDCVLMQFTGLRDKNGKEIYEGDIVEHFNGVQVVEWCEDNASFQMNLNDNVFDQELLWDGLKVEVIGNVLENPELIAGTQKGLENEGLKNCK